MKPIRDISDVHVGSVLYHSAFGFAIVEEVESTRVLLDWEHPGDNLPRRVTADVVNRVYAICPPDGFFHSAIQDPDAFRDHLQVNPVDSLERLLRDLHGPQSRRDLCEWITGRRLMTRSGAERWWEDVRRLIRTDPRFFFTGDTVALKTEIQVDGPMAQLDSPALAAGRRLDLALMHAEHLEPEVFLYHVLLAWRTGSTQVRDLAMTAVKAIDPNEVLAGLLEPGPDAIEAIIHAVRRAGWRPDQVSYDVHVMLQERILQGAEQGGPLDNEGRLSATLARWPSPGIVELLADQAVTPDGKRLLRATFSALPPSRGETLALDMLLSALEDDQQVAAQWLGQEVLGFTLVDQTEMAKRIEEQSPELAAWFRYEFKGIELHSMETYEETTDEGIQTAEIDLSDVVDEPIPLADLPARSGASLLGLGLALARALAAHHKDGRVVNPTARSVRVLPNETMDIVPGDAEDSQRPMMEPPSTTADVYSASVLLIETLLGRSWPRHIPPARAIPYLRYVIPMLPPSGLAPLDAALHPDPSKRPIDGLAWQAQWQLAAMAEEKRAYATRDPSARLQYGYDSHIGKMKLLLTQTNQDALFVGTKGPLSLLVVCDGISTANAGSGDVASSIASHVIANLWEQALPRLTQAGPSEIRDFLDRALRMANQAVCEAALRFADGNLDGRVPMGTTCVVAMVHGNRVFLSWLGDSRAYVVGSYGASLLTFDENQASERLRAWHLGYHEIWDPAGFALIGYLGHFNELLRAEALPAHHTMFVMVPGERLVMCSDGVTDYLADTHPEVSQLVAEAVSEEDPMDASRNLITLANRGGGGDNITAVVARLWDR